MSGAVVGWAMQQATGSPATKLVLIKLADNANEDGVCWPSIDLIVEHTELGRSTVYKHLLHLESIGLISLTTVQSSQSDALVQGYKLHVGSSGESPRGGLSETSSPRGGQEIPRGGKKSPRGGLHTKEGTVTEPSIEPSLFLGGGFDEWYETYPRHKDRKAAKQSYQRALNKIPHSTLVEATQRFAQSVARACTPEDKIPYAATWLNKERWADERLQAAKASPVEAFSAHIERVFAAEYPTDRRRLAECFKLTFGTDYQRAADRLAKFAAEKDPMMAANSWFFDHGKPGCECGQMVRT